MNNFTVHRTVECNKVQQRYFIYFWYLPRNRSQLFILANGHFSTTISLIWYAFFASESLNVKSDFLLYKIVNESAEKSDAHVL